MKLKWSSNYLSFNFSLNLYLMINYNHQIFSYLWYSNHWSSYLDNELFDSMLFSLMCKIKNRHELTRNRKRISILTIYRWRHAIPDRSLCNLIYLIQYSSIESLGKGWMRVRVGKSLVLLGSLSILPFQFDNRNACARVFIKINSDASHCCEDDPWSDATGEVEIPSRISKTSSTTFERRKETKQMISWL
jgi:hypothetical protein